VLHEYGECRERGTARTLLRLAIFCRRNQHGCRFRLDGDADVVNVVEFTTVRHRAPGLVLRAHVVEPASWNQYRPFVACGAPKIVPLI
jgi:hypothetical protein